MAMSQVITGVAQGESAPKVCTVGEFKSIANILAVLAMVLSIVSLKVGPRWLGRVSFSLAFLACCTIPLLV
jgi:hypothetical protein